jgi:hypothetical protein
LKQKGDTSRAGDGRSSRSRKRVKEETEEEKGEEGARRLGG